MTTEVIMYVEIGGDTHIITREDMDSHVLIRIWKLEATIREPPFDETRVRRSPK